MQQHLIYFFSHVLAEAEQRYEFLEFMAYVVLIATSKLRPYFDAHTVQVLTKQPLEKRLWKLDTTERFLKWKIELSEFDIEYMPRIAIKAQALADFIVWTTYEDTEEPVGTWQISVNGSAAQTGTGAEIVMISLEGITFEYVVGFRFKASNNKAEYEAVIAGISLSITTGAKKVKMTIDS